MNIRSEDQGHSLTVTGSKSTKSRDEKAVRRLLAALWRRSTRRGRRRELYTLSSAQPL